METFSTMNIEDKYDICSSCEKLTLIKMMFNIGEEMTNDGGVKISYICFQCIADERKKKLKEVTT